MIFRVDNMSSEPIFEQLAHQVRISIVRGELQPGEKLPPARQLAEALDVNLHTVLHAYQQLRDEGHIDLRRGRGAIVSAQTDPVPEDVIAALEQLVSAANMAKMTPQTLIALVKEATK